MKPLRDSLERNLMPLWRGKVKVLLSELKEADAAVLGASALGWEAKFAPAAPSAVPVTPTAGPAKTV